MSAPFEDTAAVQCLQLSVTKAAHTRHVGPYAGLPTAHSGGTSIAGALLFVAACGSLIYWGFRHAVLGEYAIT